MGVSRGVSMGVSYPRLEGGPGYSADSDGAPLGDDKAGPLGVMTIGGCTLVISIRGVLGVFGALDRNSSTDMWLEVDLGVRGMALLIGSLGSIGLVAPSGTGLLEIVIELAAMDLGVSGTGVCPRIVVMTSVFFSSLPRGVSMPRLAENRIGGASLTSRGRECRDVDNALYTKASEPDLRHTHKHTCECI
jgi:hypothetical protein